MAATRAVGVASTITHGQKTMSMVIALMTSPLHSQSSPPEIRAKGM
ncbi:MAG: hypothetical protein A4E45_00531 [Methanosaeta sp. PtaB.Bin039]|nr:MAG: hypothetical protein A4E45_00531 [Methanosaeta sp. PtaB.Bin039]